MKTEQMIMAAAIAYMLFKPDAAKSIKADAKELKRVMEELTQMRKTVSTMAEEIKRLHGGG